MAEDVWLRTDSDQTNLCGIVWSQHIVCCFKEHSTDFTHEERFTKGRSFTHVLKQLHSVVCGFDLKGRCHSLHFYFNLSQVHWKHNGN